MDYKEKKQEHDKRHKDFVNALLFPGFLAGISGYMESVYDEEENEEELPSLSGDREPEEPID